jgi:hypothetical protein
MNGSSEVAFSARKMQMSTIDAFMWGFGGSVAAEIVILDRCFRKAAGRLPDCYKHFWFYVVRALLAVAAGCLAIAYDVKNPVLALSIGIAAPLVIRNLKGGKDKK